MSVAWNYALADIPFERPVLVKKKGSAVPFMALREADEGQMVNVILGDSQHGYGFYAGLDELEKWADVMDGPTSA